MRCPPILIGAQFGRLTVIGGPLPGPRTRWQCRCACGAVALLKANDLNSGAVRSCGCLRRETAARSISAARAAKRAKAAAAGRTIRDSHAIPITAEDREWDRQVLAAAERRRQQRARA